MKLYLIISKGKHAGMPIEIKHDLFLIGTDGVCQLRINAHGIGTQHCAVVTRERKVFLQDLDSSNPTQVNDQLVPPGGEWPLHAGDRVILGSLEFLVQFNEKELSQKDAEEWALKCLDKASETAGEKDLEEEFGSPLRSQRHDNAASAAGAILDRMQALRGIIKGRLRIAFDSGITHVRFNDNFLIEESEVAMVKTELLNNTTHPCLRVLLDFKNIQRMSSAAAEMILEVHRQLRARGSTLALCRVKPPLQPILETLDILLKVPHFSDKLTAFQARW